jgi:apoptosis-inducing factor 3
MRYPSSGASTTTQPAAQDCAVSFFRGGRKFAVATVGRDLDSLRAELAFEQEAGS